MTTENLEFLNGLSGVLSVHLTEETFDHGSLLNQLAEPTAQVLAVELRVTVWTPIDTEENDDFRQLTAEEWNLPVFAGATIRMCGDAKIPILAESSNGTYFTVRDILRGVAVVELETRGKTEWFGGVDIHHTFFEGIYLKDDVWHICWGS